ncbi:MAG TPA: 16S rRNA (guanine(966)-N(2))-methyltransferase RsmD [Patescibacteria group bacterium]|nr:16S rRNA (guanine(966)-N(2))-methyltransferase RsmD [Patescibacteria group bacterium]
MRIIAGTLGGRIFSSPPSHRTHPMSDKMRGAIFNSLGDIEGLSVLDAFAGSGALGFEAISRGAKYATAIEVDKAAAETIKKNAASLGISGSIKAIRASLSSWLETSPQEQLFDIVLADPPYDDVRPALLAQLSEKAKPGGTILFSLPPKAIVELPPSVYRLLSAKNYGDSQLVFYRRTL